MTISHINMSEIPDSPTISALFLILL